MPKLLIINGHDTYESSPGHLNQTMVEVMREELKDKFEIQISVLKDGYETEEERRKFLEADVIIYQMPVFWFAAPALLKKYMEDVFQIGVFYVRAPEYGRGGHLTDKNICCQQPGTLRRKLSAIKTNFLTGAVVTKH